MRKVINNGIGLCGASKKGDIIEMCETKEEVIEKYGEDGYDHSCYFGDPDTIGVVDNNDEIGCIQVYAREIEEIEENN